MATGVRAFPGQTVALISDHILNREPVPPGALNSGLPVAMQQIIMRALQKRREDRYQSAGEMLQALRACADAADPGDALPLAALTVARPSKNWRRPAVVVAAALAIGLAVAIPALERFSAGSPLTDRDSILIADFINSTGEQVFDDTLKQALSIQLAQSPFLDIVPDSRVQATMTMMNQPETARVSGPLAREVCVRTNIKALLQPSIARVGSVYVITLEAAECGTGRSIAAADAQAERKEDVLRALGGITSVVRQKLGETDLKGFDVPIEQATTPSLEALQAYTAGRAQRARGAELESIPFFVRALELDPEFAAAHTVALDGVRVAWRMGARRRVRPQRVRAPPTRERTGTSPHYVSVSRSRDGRSARVSTDARPLEADIPPGFRACKRARVDFQSPGSIRKGSGRGERRARTTARPPVSAVESCVCLSRSRAVWRRAAYRAARRRSESGDGADEAPVCTSWT